MFSLRQTQINLHCFREIVVVKSNLENALL
jgi:hypothetical protein